MSVLGERVRLRLREELARQKLSQPDVADLIGWTQSRVAQKLTGRTPITLDELEALAFAVGMSPTELIRDRGFEFCAEMTPSEFKALQQLRLLLPPLRKAFETMLEAKAAETRQASPRRPILGKPKAK